MNIKCGKTKWFEYKAEDATMNNVLNDLQNMLMKIIKDQIHII